jgi:hypothetical protein
MGGAIAEIAAVADFELSNEAGRPFVEFVHWVNARPAFISRWRADPISESPSGKCFKDYRAFVA